MFSAVLVCSSLIAALPAEGPSSPDQAAYEAARAQAGRDPEAHVKLALWCEAHGLKAERMKHLAIAVLTDPKNAMARGLLGLVAHRGHWQRPEAVADALKADAKLAAAIEQYKDRRVKAPTTADGQWKLALWCEENGLKAEATAHLSAVVRLDPSREAAWKRLGYKKQGGRWITEAQLADEKAEADRQKQADRHWKPILERWRGWLDDKARRPRAETALSDVTDPRAAPMVWAVFATRPADRQAIAVRTFGQIDSADASRALATLAIFGKSDDVRRAATEILRRRDAREYADILIALIRDPIKYEVKPVGGPGSPGALYVEGKRANVRRNYVPPPLPEMQMPFSRRDLLTYDIYGLPVIVRNAGVSGYIGPDGIAITGPTGATYVGSNSSDFQQVGPGTQGFLGPQPGQAIVQEMIHAPGHAAAIVAANQGKRSSSPNMGSFTSLTNQLMARGFNTLGNPSGNTILIGQAILETEMAAVQTQQQLMSDVASIEQQNARAVELNTQVTQVLNSATDQALPAEASAWEGWWTNQLGYAQRSYDEPKPTFVQTYSPQLPPVAGFQDNSFGYFRRISCFGAGTKVHTISGLRPIETLREGDQVLTQDIKTGALNYRPILVMHRNPPSPTYTIDLEGEAIVSSHFHRFWKAGRGWVMARDLKPGDIVRTLGGLVKVGSIEAGGVQPVFNLDVAEDADFFVGDRGALVHDNTLPDLRLAPFDAPPSLASSGSMPAPR